MSTDNSKAFRLPDIDVRPAGSWFYWKRGVRLKIAPLSTRAFASQVHALLRAAAEKEGRPIMDSERAVIAGAELESVAAVVLLDWENLDHEHTGRALEYTRSNAIDQLVMRTGLFDFVIEKAKTLHAD